MGIRRASPGTAKTAYLKKTAALAPTAAEPAPEKAAAKTTATRSSGTQPQPTSRRIAEMLHDLKIGGEAFSAQVARLRLRFS